MIVEVFPDWSQSENNHRIALKHTSPALFFFFFFFFFFFLGGGGGGGGGKGVFPDRV